MKVAWTTAPGADSKASGKMSFSPGRKSRGLFMTHVNPVDRLSSPQRVSKTVERVSHHSVDALHARFLEGFDQIFGCSFAHRLLFPIARTSPRVRAVDLQSRGLSDRGESRHIIHLQFAFISFGANLQCFRHARLRHLAGDTQI